MASGQSSLSGEDGATVIAMSVAATGHGRRGRMVVESSEVRSFLNDVRKLCRLF